MKLSTLLLVGLFASSKAKDNDDFLFQSDRKYKEEQKIKFLNEDDKFMDDESNQDLKFHWNMFHKNSEPTKQSNLRSKLEK